MRNPLFLQQFPGSLAAIVNAGVFPNNVFFVDSTNTTGGANSAGGGISPDAPFLTLAYALTQCTADKGDVIFLMPGHTEAVVAAAGIALSVGGVRVIGLGRGAKRATFNFTTLTTATITIAGNDVVLENLLFVNGIDSLANMLTISGADVVIDNCEVRDNNASFACIDAIVTTAAANRLMITNHTHRANGGKTGAATQIKIVGGDGVTIQPRMMDGDCSVANIRNVTTACTDLRIFGSGSQPAYLRNRNAALVGITLHASSTGQVGPNISVRISAAGASNITNAVVGAAMDFYQPISIVNTAGTVGLNTTITASANS